MSDGRGAITEEIKRQTDRDEKFIDSSLKNLDNAIKNCLPHTAEIAIQIMHSIDRQKSKSEIYLALGDQPEKAHHQVMERADRQRDELDELIKKFTTGCKCMASKEFIKEQKKEEEERLKNESYGTMSLG